MFVRFGTFDSNSDAYFVKVNSVLKRTVTGADQL